MGETHAALKGQASTFVSDGSDKALALAARYDPEAFLPLYRRYVDRIYRYCLVRLNERAAAEDATSEVFFKALSKLPGYHGGSFAAWLFAIARNEVNNHARRRPTVPLDAAMQESASTDDPEAQAILHVQRAALQRALPSLSKPQHTLIELQLAGWSDAEIAEAMGKTRDAVKMLRQRTLKRLREVLPRSGWDPGERAARERSTEVEK